MVSDRLAAVISSQVWKSLLIKMDVDMEIS